MFWTRLCLTGLGWTVHPDTLTPCQSGEERETGPGRLEGAGEGGGRAEQQFRLPFCPYLVSVTQTSTKTTAWNLVHHKCSVRLPLPQCDKESVSSPSPHLS